MFPVATTAASPSVRAAVAKLVAAADTATTMILSGTTGPGDVVHLKRRERITTLNRKDETP